MDRRPTDRQLEYLRKIAELIERNGYPPTVREVGKALGIKSPSTVAGMLQRLQRHGLIEWAPESPRTIRLTEAGRRAVQGGTTVACERFRHWTDEDYRILWMALASFLDQAAFIKGDLSPEQAQRARRLYQELREFVKERFDEWL